MEEGGKTHVIQGVIKLKKRIVPNSILFGGQKTLLCEVDPRKQQSSGMKWTGHDAKEESSPIPAELRFKEMRLNHYGFYDIDFTAYNKFITSFLPSDF